MVHYGAGRLSLKGSCSITVAEVSGAGESMERWSHTAAPHPTPFLPQAHWITLWAAEVLHHPACSGPPEACSAVTHGWQKHTISSTYCRNKHEIRESSVIKP